MTLSQRLAEYVRACFTGLWIESHEHEDALAEIALLCHAENWRLATWDIDRGLLIGKQNPAETGQDPLAAVRALSALADPEGTALLVLVNFHRFLNSPEIVQALARQITAGKQNRTFVVILAPVVQIPVELEKLFVCLEHELPSREQLQEIAAGIADKPGELPDGAGLGSLLDAAAGLTRYEAEGAFSLSIVRHCRLAPETIWELKSQMLKKSGLLQLHRGEERFNDLGGLEALKEFCRRALRQRTEAKPAARPRGILLLSPPGCGKSAISKALGNELGRPTLILDVGALMGSLVGQTEQNIRQALKIADAMAPCVLMADELDKALSGVASSGQTDSGVSARLFGTLLTWLNDHETDVFFVGTLNDVSRLPPEFSRAERFDGVFFVDLPGQREKQTIWQMYLDKFGLNTKQQRPVDADWTGAEIRACCRLSALLDMPLLEAGKNIVPVAATAAESVERLRNWASGRCLSADKTGIYRREASSEARRRISRNAANN
ncbi:MAG TPA: AAA family ATPase [Planctomycetaceae bacterium]|nr:AAA family ATPase [Planctomycetaceae bacterium]